MAKMHLLSKKFLFPTKRNWPGTAIEMTMDRIRKFKRLSKTQRILKSDQMEFIQKLVGDYLQEYSFLDLEHLPSGVIHGDITFENIKFKNNKLIGIFDFDDCRESYFIEDIAKALLYEFEYKKTSFFGAKGDSVFYYLKEYEKYRRLTKPEKEYLPFLFKTRCLYILTFHFFKLLEGKKEYKKRTDMFISRYKDNQKFFTQQFFE